MSIICWGNLGKSAVDAQKIEQAIDGYMSGHDRNPNAHMGENYSLGAHRLQLILDHTDSSVNASKVAYIIDDQDGDITYSGTWSSVTNSIQFYHRSYHLSNTPTDYAEYTFSGTRVGIFAAKGPSMGKIDVYIDGDLDETVDLYSALLLTKFGVYEKTGLSNASHTIKVIIRADKNASSSDYQFFLDAFELSTLIGGTNIYQVQVGANFTGNLNANGYATATFPIFAGHEFLCIFAVVWTDPVPDSADNVPKVAINKNVVVLYNGDNADDIDVTVFALFLRS